MQNMQSVKSGHQSHTEQIQQWSQLWKEILMEYLVLETRCLLGNQLSQLQLMLPGVRGRKIQVTSQDLVKNRTIYLTEMPNSVD